MMFISTEAVTECADGYIWVFSPYKAAVLRDTMKGKPCINVLSNMDMYKQRNS